MQGHAGVRSSGSQKFKGNRGKDFCMQNKVGAGLAN